MAELGAVAWPPPPISTPRLVLREPEPRDRGALVELLSSPEVHAHLGGPRPRPVAPPPPRPGLFVVDLDGAVIGTVTLGRHDPGRPGRVLPEGGEIELSYLFVPSAWGHGYAGEARAAVLDWCAGAWPGEPVVLCTQSANARSVRLAERLGFTEVARFEEFGAEQWFGVRHP